MTLDHRDLELAYHKYGATVLRRALCLLSNEDAAWEAVHQVFLSLLERPEQYQGKSSMLTFLYGATTHHCLNQLRNEKTRLRLMNARGKDDGVDRSLRPDDFYTLRRRLTELPPELSEVAVYFHLDRMSYDEIAEITGYSRRKVAQLLSRLKDEVPNGN